MSRNVIESFESKYEHYKLLGETALDQLDRQQLSVMLGEVDSSVATIAWHVAGNLRSRFTDFLTTDGEKEWRDRESEFMARDVSHDELRAFWDRGWSALVDALGSLHDSQLEDLVTIRGQNLTIFEALLRSVTHTSYHVGQMIFLAKHLRGSDWKYASIPPGGSAAYNDDPTMERGLPGRTKG